MNNYHILYKEKSEDVYSKGENVEADDPIKAISSFSVGKANENKTFVFLGMYCTTNMSLLESLQNDHYKDNSSSLE